MRHIPSSLKNLTRLLPAMLASMLLLTACGSGSSVMNEKAGRANKSYAVAETAAAAYAVPSAMADFGSYEEAAEDSTSGSGSVSLDVSAADAEQHHGKLIRTIHMSLESRNYDALLSDIRTKVNAFGGYIETSSEYSFSEDHRSSELTVRIPSDKADAFLSEALSGGRVTSRSESTEDVTLTYSDLETRMETLRTEQETLTRLLSEAQSIEAVIALETRLTEISYELENAGRRLKVYDNQIQYTTIYLTLQEVDLEGPSHEAGFLEKVAVGIEQNFLDICSFMGGLCFALIVSLPTLIVLAVFVLLIVLLVGKIKRTIAARKTKKKTAAEAEAVEPVRNKDTAD